MKMVSFSVVPAARLNLQKTEFITALAEHGIIKFGEFKLKSGDLSPFYIDFRDIVAFPGLIAGLVELLCDELDGSDFDLVAGIPYTALPIATMVAQRLNKGLIYPRKEKKNYGTGKQIEGRYTAGSRVLVIDDVMSTGASKVEIGNLLEAEKLQVATFLVIVDRSPAGVKAELTEKGFQLHSLFTLTEVFEILLSANYVTMDMVAACLDFVAGQSEKRRQALPTLGKIAAASKNTTLRDLVAICEAKKSNLVLSADVEKSEELFALIDKTADHICMLKTHIDIVEDYSFVVIERLRQMANKYNFMLFEDRKFADIGNTVRKQFHQGVYRIASWADFITVHSLPGAGIINGLFADGEAGSAFLLANMSAAGNLIDDNYQQRTLQMGAEHSDKVAGFIGFAKTVPALQKLRAAIPAGMLLLMPGVNLQRRGDTLGQQYVDVATAVRGGADLIIVGRGIYAEDDPEAAAAAYRRESWSALENR
jgi:uridine monophosphate synthetase